MIIKIKYTQTSNRITVTWYQRYLKYSISRSMYRTWFYSIVGGEKEGNLISKDCDQGTDWSEIHK